ncbi:MULTISPECIES: uracil-DNA glycosylase family protein [Bacillus]|nr:MULTISPECIES: uracil-DNA glycosylase family protein [Bacillus]MCA1033089.1 hypothetical protein [Bacillus infantis]MDT0161201.1 hypothetical protein [Bacillus sp. AG4(2022)]RYI28338.1 hypothetical protein EVU96_14280 [Bacillus infantis]
MMINKQLYNLYEKYYPGMLSSLEGNNLSNPLLLKINDEEQYQKADLKVMFLGQETNTWEGSLGSKSIEELLGTYSRFFGEGKCFRYGGPFWNTVKDYTGDIKEAYPDKRVEIVWNNLIKLGKENSKGAPKKSLVAIQKEAFPVIREELEILKPDVVLFFTGPRYDQYLKAEWPNLTYHPLAHEPAGKLARLKGGSLHPQAFRTYHPNYLYRAGKPFYNSVKKSIISSISITPKVFP